jgi:hypothetical protein
MSPSSVVAKLVGLRAMAGPRLLELFGQVSDALPRRGVGHLFALLLAVALAAVLAGAGSGRREEP